MAENAGTMHTESEQKIVRIAKKLTIKWRIDKFESQQGYLKLESEGVSSGLDPRVVLKVRLEGMDTSESYLPLSQYVYLHVTGPMSWRLWRSATISTSSGKRTASSTRFVAAPYYSYSKRGSLSRERSKKALHSDGSLVVAADIEFLPPYSNGSMAIDESDLFTKWHDSVCKLRESGDYSDCILMVGGEKLKAHRSILSAISPIFGKMFGNGRFQEARDGVVRIEDPPGMLKDSTAKPYKTLLTYAYSGCVDWSVYSECKRDVLVVACKYLVLDLKRHVEKLFINEITSENLAELAILADTYSCDQLKSSVVLTPQWDALMKSRVEMASELLRLVRESKTPAPAGGGTK